MAKKKSNSQRNANQQKKENQVNEIKEVKEKVVLLIATAKKGTRLGISLSMSPTAILTALIPGTFINLCMMNTMRCHSVMKPAVIIMSVVTALCALVNAVLEWREA